MNRVGLCGLAIVAFLITRLPAAIPRAGEVVTITNQSGRVFADIRVIRLDEVGIVYGLTTGVGGGRIKWDELTPTDAIAFGRTHGQATLKPDQKPAAAIDMAALEFPELRTKLDPFDQLVQYSVAIAVTNKSGAVLLFVAIRFHNQREGSTFVSGGLRGPPAIGILSDSGSMVVLMDERRWEPNTVPQYDFSQPGMFATVTDQMPENLWRSMGETKSLRVRMRTTKGFEDFDLPADLFRKLAQYVRAKAPQLEGLAANPKAAPQTGNAKAQTSAPARAAAVECTAADFRITEQNTVYWRVAFKATISNPTAVGSSMDWRVQLLDRDGFELDDHLEYGFVVNPGSSREMSGSILLRTEKGPKLSRIQVTPRR